MPEVSRFYGMIVKMFFSAGEHNPPHIHVLYGEYAGLFDIRTGEMFEGDLPVRALSLLKEWLRAHRDELLEMWRTQKIRRLPPLE